MGDRRSVDAVPSASGAPASTPVLAAEARGVRVRHDGAAAWTPDGIDVTVAPGEVLLVLGPSGCGKSTFALTLNGLVPHAVPADVEGSVRVGGVLTRDATVAELSEHTGMVFQDPDAQLVARTVLDEVCFGPENRLLPVAEVEARAESALRAVGLWERRDDDPDTLSGGGRQRLAIACALALDAPLLVLDEPTSNLDPAGAEEVYRLLGRLTVAGSTRSVVLIEHDLDLALPIADTVLVLDGAGRPFAYGPARELIRDRAEELNELGVWLPTATTAALRLRAAGIPLDPLPLTASDLTRALSPAPVPPPSSTQTLHAPEPDRVQFVRTRRRAEAPEGEEHEGDERAAAAVRVEGLTVRRGRRTVLEDVSLRVGRGEFLAVVGPNGAGKTTLVQAIAGVARAPRSTIDVLGLNPARASVQALRETVGFVFQNPEHQFVTHTVEDELTFGLRQRRLPTAEIADRVDAMLAVLGLADRRSAHPFLLSGGQKRRLSVGTALIEGAPVLVLDEPTFGQDRARATELLDLLAELNSGGTTVIAVTHDLGLIGEYASHVAIVAGGRLPLVGETARILGDPALLESHGLRQPVLARALADPAVPEPLRGLSRLADLPAAR
ncbi:MULTISPECIES: ABC transporter ATP-binding protein [unclassified Leifsonia]|uniref:ABC transporter ATP-binding protein n=1 Tax=unclassified Leifsonia TaxID=2663824 RepID=UPI0010D30906|nr:MULTISPECIES: ABC transporter ATP-binding protein [unclassified Leifsonia]TDP98542.1 energy-coupling factor transport system ATP-binding protein [Leifsonia sp. 115AMFTsu3.1]